jgi:hypothetical protein
VKGVLHRPEDEAVKRAVREMQRAGFDIADVRTQYPVHGLEKVANVPASRLGWACAAGGALGAALIVLFQTWTSATDWALDVGGKPFNSVPAFIPVTFEVGVLLAAFATVGAFFFRSRLWPGRKGTALGDRFEIVVHAHNAAFDRKTAERIASRYDIGLDVADTTQASGGR